MGPSSFVPQSSVRQSKLAPQCLVASSSASYFSATTFGHFGDVDVKMTIIFAAKDDEENEVEENPKKDPEEDFAEETEATGSPLHSKASSQSEEFYHMWSELMGECSL
ncbi:hypothetical protein DVH24_042512 [Malus domestica]|uniref:Uncharacterized protein n=1 Tax=Malus domestica TaxID=3750 RepID=A0A498JAK2_MALDO|nr:hypothetical protein DVH24_042512 [Malus domestica]